MEALKQAVAAAFDNVVASGAIEKTIEKKLNETISSAIEEHLRSYGDFGQAIKAKVSQALNVNLDRMDFPSYGDLILNILRRQLDAQMQGEFAKRFEADMVALLAPAPAEITIDTLVEKFINSYKERYGESRAGQEFTLRIENDGGSFTYICLDQEPRKSKYDCAFRIGVHDGEVFNLAIGNQDVKNKLFIGPLYDFEKLVFQMYTAKTKIIIPADADASDYPNRFPYPGEDD
jgi:hypothetical protein